LLDEKLRDVADAAVNENITGAGAVNDVSSSSTNEAAAAPTTVEDPSLVKTAKTAQAGDFYEATVVKGASGLLLGVGPVAASSSSTGEGECKAGEEVATGLCITRFREPPQLEQQTGDEESMEASTVTPFRHPLEEQGVLLGDVIAAFSTSSTSSMEVDSSSSHGDEDEATAVAADENTQWLHVEQWPYEDVRAKLLSMPLGQQAVLFRRSHYTNLPGNDGTGASPTVAAATTAALPTPRTPASAQRAAAAAGTAISQLLQLTRLPPLPSGVAGRWVADQNPLHKHRAATRASNAAADFWREGGMHSGVGGEPGLIMKRREGAFRALGASETSPSEFLAPMHASGATAGAGGAGYTGVGSAIAANTNTSEGAAGTSVTAAAAPRPPPEPIDLIEVKGRRARPGFISSSGTSIASAAAIKSYARALALARGEERAKTKYACCC